MLNITRYKVNTFFLSVLALVSLQQNWALSLRRERMVGVQVLSPTEFKLDLPEAKLLNIFVSVHGNSDLERGNADFERNETDERVLYFSSDNLNLTKGDTIFYLGLFIKLGQIFGHGGRYVFDGVVDNSTRDKHEALEEPQPQHSEENSESTTHIIEPRSGRFKKHWFGPSRNRFHSSHRRHFGNYGPSHFGHQYGRPLVPPLFHYRPGHWGHGHRDRFGDRGPWDGHGTEEDFYDGQLGNRKPWIEEGDNGNTGLDENKPTEVLKPVYEHTDGTDENEPKWNVSSTTTSNDNSGSSNENSTSGSTLTNEINPVISEETITTTTEDIPQIDIRFPEIDQI